MTHRFIPSNIVLKIAEIKFGQRWSCKLIKRPPHTRHVARTCLWIFFKHASSLNACSNADAFAVKNCFVNQGFVGIECYAFLSFHSFLPILHASCHPRPRSTFRYFSHLIVFCITAAIVHCVVFHFVSKCSIIHLNQPKSFANYVQLFLSWPLTHLHHDLTIDLCDSGVCKFNPIGDPK